MITFAGWSPSEKPGKVKEFNIGEGKVREISKVKENQRNCGLPVVLPQLR